MRLFLSSVCICILLLAAGCERREPLTRGQVLAIADMKVELMGQDWGTPREVIEATDLNGDGIQYWTVRYPEGPGDALRIVYVNADTHWAQLREGEPIETDEKIVTERVGARSEKDMALSTYVPGSYILVLAQGEQAVIRTEVRRLNKLAQEHGLIPLFSARPLPAGDFQLIFGWQGEHGTKKIDAIKDWVELRTEYDNSVWLDLLGAE